VTPWLRWATLGACGLCCYWAAAPLACAWRRYANALGIRLRVLLPAPPVTTVTRVQLGLVLSTVAVAAASESPAFLLAGLAVAAAPWVAIRWAQRQRAAAIERQLQGFLLTLSNSLRVTPNLATALATLPTLLAPPLREEVNLVCRELRVGGTLDEALQGLCRRTSSPALDAAVTALLVGRRLGGDLPRILATTAAALRELERLDGVVRARTSEARAQLWVLALCPFGFVAALAAVSPGYFVPLAASAMGWAIALGAGLLWLGALLVARRVLAVMT
jgi:tight adherence protein B